MNRFFLFLLILSFSVPAYSQYTISGLLTDKNDDSPLASANILLRNPKDSSMIKGGISNSKGFFRITDVENGNYLLTLRFIGYKEISIPLKVSDANVDLKKITMDQHAVRLNGLSITEDAVALVQKDDTSEYNAAAFKVNPDATTEDLVAKMPGVVIQDGKIQAQGTEVKKVLVDGKPFFGNDPSAALKNLPAEAVDKIQVYDSKSEQAQFTGFDDDDVSKAINIITKLPFRNGAFGRAFAGYGYEDKWRGGVLANVFQGDRRITIMLNTNNVNEQNFTIDDIMGVMSSVGSGMGGGGATRMMGGGGNAMRIGGGGFGGGMRTNFMNTSSGINTTNSLGINFLDQLGNKVEFSGSYFFNYTKNETTSETNRQYITEQQQGFTYKESNKSSSVNMNHRLNFKIDYKIDSMNSLLFEPRLTIQQATGKSSFEGENFFQAITTNTVFTKNTTESFGWNTAFPILYRHSFAKKRRTFSINVTPSFNQTEGDNEQQSNTYDTIATGDSFNQLTNLNKKGVNFSGNFVYTEPLSTNLSLMINYYGNYNNNHSDKRNNRYDPITQSYIVLDTSLSNVFRSEYYSNSGGISMKYSKEKWYVTPGVSMQASSLSNEQTFPSAYSFSPKSFLNVLPSIEYQYRFSKTNNLRINYRTSTKDPSISDLQEVLDNSNTLQLSIGNEELDQSWQNTLNMRYSISNPTKGTNLFVSLSGTYTLDYIGKQTIIASESKQYYGVDLDPGVQLTRPMNFDDYYNMRAFAGFGLPIKLLKTNFNVNLNGGYTHSPSLINEDMNYSNTSNVGLGLVFSSNISEKIDFMLFSNSSMNYVENTLQSSQNSKYLRQDVRFKINLMPVAGLVIQTELNDQYYSSFEGNSDQNYLLWNAAIGYKFLAKRQLEVKLSVYDILNQNQNLTRNTTETYNEDVITNTLTQYFMLSLSWNFTTFKSRVPQDMMPPQQSKRMEF